MAAKSAPPEISDAQLIARCLVGDDRHAFAELVKRHQSPVRACLRKLTAGNHALADDLAQETFVLAWRNLKSFRQEVRFSTWLYRIATNAALMKYRKRRDGHVSLEQSQSGEGTGEPMQIPDWSQQPLNELLNSETHDVMEEGVEKLPEELRTVFVLRDVEGLSNAEVAEVLNLSVAAVKSRLHRARIALRDRLNRYFADKLTRRDGVR